MDKKKGVIMFPVYYDGRLVNQAEEWLAEGKPELSPIFIRNRVKVWWSKYDSLVGFRPIHEEFILVEGVEAPLSEEAREDWIADYPLVVNPAKWPEKPQSEEGLRVLVAVDPTLPERVRNLFARSSQEILKARAEEAARKAFTDWHNRLAAESESVVVPRGPYEKDKIRFTGDGGLLYEAKDWSLSRYRIAYYTERQEPGRSSTGYVRYAAMGWEAGSSELTVIESWEPFTISKDVKLPETVNTVFKARFAELKEVVEKAKAGAKAQTLEIRFPTVEPIEKGYPKPKLPPQLKVSRNPGTLRTTGAIGRWHDAARRMAETLGYKPIRSYSSNTGRTAFTEYILPGQADPRTLSSYITRVDSERGILYVAKENIGRVIGSGGHNIKRINELTGRRWKVLPENG